MDTATVFRAMDLLPNEQRIQFAMDVWDHAIDSGSVPDLSSEQKAELVARMAELDANPSDVFTWEETKQFLTQ